MCMYKTDLPVLSKFLWNLGIKKLVNGFAHIFPWKESAIFCHHGNAYRKTDTSESLFPFCCHLVFVVHWIKLMCWKHCYSSTFWWVDVVTMAMEVQWKFNQQTSSLMIYNSVGGHYKLHITLQMHNLSLTKILLSQVVALYLLSHSLNKHVKYFTMNQTLY